jgi:hypothetical protein
MCHCHDGPLQHPHNLADHSGTSSRAWSALLAHSEAADRDGLLRIAVRSQSAVVEVRRRLQVQRLARLWPRLSIGQSVAPTAQSAAVHELERAVSACDAACPEVRGQSPVGTSQLTE